LINKLTLPADQIQGRLLLLATLFLVLFSTILTLSPAGQTHTWDVTYRWDHWIGLVAWVALFAAAHLQTSRHLPDRDPYLLPLAGLLSGWGLLTIWRLFPAFGLRQTLWLAIAVLALILLVRLPTTLAILRRYKYIWLSLGLFLTALTLLFGTNPSGASFSRLWLGWLGVYFQPSEPLKLFLVVYLAAYLAGSDGEAGAAAVLKVTRKLLPLLAPTVIMAGLALLILLFQRDLGTAFIFLSIYFSVVYVASARKIILVMAVLAIVLSGLAGYLIFDVVRIRTDAWLNPWLDPSGRSYQIVQSLLAIANGGLLGRGPGMGSPRVVPVSHSDFIFISIVEEGGLLAAVGLLSILALFVTRGMRTALCAPNSYQRYLAAGLTAFLVAQSILIVGGNLRLLPLTGVTLPFMSYGGSSLLTAFLSLGILVHISSQAESGQALLSNPRPYLILSSLLFAGLAMAALMTGWWSVLRATELLERTDNPRRTIANRFVPRGTIYDRSDAVLSETTGSPGSFVRTSRYPELSLVTGYDHPVYGQSGLEASMDSFLRGLEGYPPLDIFWNHLLYGQPPNGLNVRLTISLELQQAADDLLRGRQGALVLMNAQNGDILVMASYPNFDPNQLEQTWAELLQDERAPLVNRATQGSYQPGPTLATLSLPAFYDPDLVPGGLPALPGSLSYALEMDGTRITLDCAATPASFTWGGVLSAGCPRPAANIGGELARDTIVEILEGQGFYSAPAVRLPAAEASIHVESSIREDFLLGQSNLRVTPLQMVLGASTISSGGTRPAPRLVLAVQSPEGTWTPLGRLSEPVEVVGPEAAGAAAEALAADDLPVWQTLAVAANGPGQFVTWYLGGTLPSWPGTPLAIAFVLEEQDPLLAEEIGRSLLQSAMRP
jgi:cell division protein FtsW (lipid II flippase)